MCIMFQMPSTTCCKEVRICQMSSATKFQSSFLNAKVENFKHLRFIHCEMGHFSKLKILCQSILNRVTLLQNFIVLIFIYWDLEAQLSVTKQFGVYMSSLGKERISPL